MLRDKKHFGTGLLMVKGERDRYKKGKEIGKDIGLTAGYSYRCKT